MQVVEVTDKKTINDFIKLPQRLYNKKQIVQSEKDEKQILTNNHPLSHKFSVYSYIVYDEDKCIARISLFDIHKENKGYIGYFEFENNLKATSLLVDQVKDKARELGINNLIGPVNGSFWVGYRLKLNNFNLLPFTGEPNNLDYYPKMYEQLDFELVEEYVSNYYQESLTMHLEKKAKLRYQQSLDKYQFISPKKDKWNEKIEEIYYMIMKLYKNFPEFSEISLNEFKVLFGFLKYIIDFDVVKLVYYQNQLVAFSICVPNYNNLASPKIGLKDLFKLIKIKHKAKEYIVMYVGVDKEHAGLGLAMSYLLGEIIYKKKATSIGALIHQGKFTQYYGKEQVINTTRYGLYKLLIE